MANKEKEIYLIAATIIDKKLVEHISPSMTIYVNVNKLQQMVS